MFPTGLKGPPGPNEPDVCKTPAPGPWQPQPFPNATDLKETCPIDADVCKLPMPWAPDETQGMTLKGVGAAETQGMTLKGVGAAETQGMTLKGGGKVDASLGPFGGMYDNPPESSSDALLKKEKKDKNLQLPGKDQDIKEVKHL